MIKDIMKDPIFLAQKSVEAKAEDASVGQDLLDTLKANEDRCVGMAANMIGVLKRIIVIRVETTYKLMYNPVILKTGGQWYETQEGCLSLLGERKTKRYEKIKVSYLDEHFKKKIQTFTGFTAQIIQHEIDHCDGIVI